MAEALSALPAQVDCAGDIAQAIALAGTYPYALWIIDAHLPDGDGSRCLEALRARHDTAALAVTAGAEREELDALCSAGFLGVLLKPVSIALLQGTVRRLLGADSEFQAEAAPGKLPVWDEARALAAIGGNVEALRSLRKLFLEELPVLRQQLLAAQMAGNAAGMQALLHKLKAGCGFVGAARLARAVDALDASPLDNGALRHFDFAATDALQWHDAQP